MSRRTYVDNSYNRSIGRVGMPLGSASVSRSSGSFGGSSGTYVDNSSNRSLGRVGLPLGSAVHSRSSGGSSSQLSSSITSRSYVDNAQNRSLGRVGLPLGSAVHSRSSGGSSHQSSYGITTYVDNAFNRRLGRVGLPLGSAVNSRSSGVSSPVSLSVSSGNKSKTYVDNAHNRKLGRVGLPLGSAVESRGSPGKGNMENLKKLLLHEKACHQQKLWEELQKIREDAINDEDIYNCDQIEGILNRQDAAMAQGLSPMKKPIICYDHIIDFAELEIGDKIGNGGFADVHIAMWKNEYPVAVKKLRVQRVSKARKAEFENEIKLLSTLKHPAIVTFYGACVETPNLAIVMEFMPKGSLHDIIICETIQLTDEQKKSIIQDALSALNYIHHERIAHRDIKSRNILVCDNLSNCKLADFGLALKEYNDTSTSFTKFVGTIKYSPPEILNGDHLNTDDLMAADVYSMALTIVEIISEEEPFDGYNMNQVRKAVLSGETPSLKEVPTPLKALLSECMGKAKQRPQAAILLHRFLDAKNDLWCN